MEKIDVLAPNRLLTEPEFNTLLEAYKKQDPIKYEEKLASGEFDRQRKLHGFVVEPKAEVNPEVATDEAGAEVAKRGRTKKEEAKPEVTN